jgi:nucleotide-binding universal stress UspA family protein
MESYDEKIAVRKILLPVKFSQTGSNAFSMALTLAKCCIARLDILSVFNPHQGLSLSEEERFKKAFETEESRFKESHLPLLGNFRSYQFARRKGDPATEILKYAESKYADLIILGCHFRKSQPCYNRLGEVAQLIFQWAPCGVMLVPCGPRQKKECANHSKPRLKRIWEGDER